MNVSELLGLTYDDNAKFVNIRLDEDTKLFLNPYLFCKDSDSYCQKAKTIYKSYCESLRYNCLNGNLGEISSALENLHELQFSRLGYAEDGRRGKGNGKDRCDKLYNEITQQWIEQIVKKGIEFSDLFWVIDGLGADCMSDDISNIIIEVLVEFTHNQFKDLGVKNTGDFVTIKYRSVSDSCWQEKKVWMPIDENGKPFLLTPKKFVTTGYQLAPQRLVEQIFVDHKNGQERLRNIGVLVHFEEDMTKEHKRKALADFEISTKEMLRNFFVLSPAEFAKSKSGIIKKTKNQARNFGLKAIKILTKLTKKPFISIRNLAKNSSRTK